jgi:hypothetical protein
MGKGAAGTPLEIRSVKPGVARVTVDAAATAVSEAVPSGLSVGAGPVADGPAKYVGEDTPFKAGKRLASTGSETLGWPAISDWSGL